MGRNGKPLIVQPPASPKGTEWPVFLREACRKDQKTVLKETEGRTTAIKFWFDPQRKRELDRFICQIVSEEKWSGKEYPLNFLMEIFSSQSRSTLNGLQQSQIRRCKPIQALKSQLKLLMPPNSRDKRPIHSYCRNTAPSHRGQHINTLLIRLPSVQLKDIFLHLFLDRIRLK